MNHNSINQEQTHFSDAEGLLDFAAIKLSSSDSAENRINGHLNTQHSLYSH